MNKKPLTGIILIAAFCVLAFLFWSAKLARKKSEDILAKFKEVDSSIVVKNDSLSNQLKGNGAMEADTGYSSNFDVFFGANKILTSIDTIKRNLRVITNKDKPVEFSAENKQRLIALKIELLRYQLFIKNKFAGKSNIQQDDFINVSDKIIGGNTVPWEVYYFANSNFYSATTLLSAIQQRILAFEKKVIKAG